MQVNFRKSTYMMPQQSIKTKLKIIMKPATAAIQKNQSGKLTRLAEGLNDHADIIDRIRDEAYHLAGDAWGEEEPDLLASLMSIVFQLETRSAMLRMESKEVLEENSRL